MSAACFRRVANARQRLLVEREGCLEVSIFGRVISGGPEVSATRDLTRVIPRDFEIFCIARRYGYLAESELDTCKCRVREMQMPRAFARDSWHLWVVSNGCQVRRLVRASSWPSSNSKLARWTFIRVLDRVHSSLASGDAGAGTVGLLLLANNSSSPQAGGHRLREPAKQAWSLEVAERKARSPHEASRAWVADDEPFLAVVAYRHMPEAVADVVLCEVTSSVRTLLDGRRGVPDRRQHESSCGHLPIRADRVIMAETPLAPPLVDDRPRVDTVPPESGEPTPRVSSACDCRYV